MGLLRMVGRTAAIAGTASAVSGRVQHRQARKFAAQDAPPAYEQAPPQYQQQPAYQQPAPEQTAAPTTTDMLKQLKELGELKAQGVLTEDEFNAQKARILAR